MGEVDERYQRGQIYTIRNINDDTMIYVGSTINTLPKRFHRHKEGCKMCLNVSLYNYITNNDWTGWYIELYENFPCNNKKELNRREGEVIREIGTINKLIAGRTKKEYYEDNADKIKEKGMKYYEDNKEKVKEYKKIYRKNNPEKVKEYNNKYYEDNAEKINEINKIYRENNADKINKKICCDICGAFSMKRTLKRHQQSKKCRSVSAQHSTNNCL